MIKKYEGRTLYLYDEAKEILIEGVNMLASAVGATLGPGGRNILIENTMGEPYVTKDGVTVAKSIHLKPPHNMGAGLIRKAAERLADKCGDNTSTATVLTQKMVNEGFRMIKDKGINPKVLFNQMKEAHDVMQDTLTKQIISSDEYNISDIAYTSSNSDIDMTDKIIEAFNATGLDGLILVDESRSGNTYIQETNGFQYDKGYVSPQFNLNKETTTITLENARILIYDKKIDRLEYIKEVLLKVAKNEESIVLIAEDYDPQVLAMLIMNVRSYGLKAVAIKAPSYGENRYTNLEDIAALTSGTVISQNNGLSLSDIRYEDLGKCETIKITEDSFTLINPDIDQTKYTAQKQHAEYQFNNTNLNRWENDQAKSRLARLRNKVVTIMIGGITDVDVKEKKDRYDDAIRALSVAVKHGIVAGGGLALLNCRVNETGKFNNLGSTVMNKAVYEPFRLILYNAGFSTKEVLTLLKTNKYYNIDGDSIKYTNDLKSTRCIDPYLAASESLKTALHVAGSILLNEGIVMQDLKFDAQGADVSQII